MAINFGTPIVNSSIVTAAGTVIIPKASTTALFVSTATPTKFNTAGLTGFKMIVPFEFVAALGTTNVTVAASIPGGVGTTALLATNKFAPVPAGSILSWGVRCSVAETAGNVSFTLMNGGTIIAGTTLTLNTTNTSVLNSASFNATAKAFSANSLRVKAKTGAAHAPTTGRANGIILVEI